MSKKNTLTEMRHNGRFIKIRNIALCVTLLAIALSSACKKDDYTEVVGVCAIVASTDPADKAVDVALNKVISVMFNTAMNASTINTQTFIIKQGTTTIAGVVAPTSNPAVYTFKPNQPLLPFTVYTGTITTGAVDTLRTALVSDYVWTFTTIPQVTLSAAPAAGGTTTGGGTFARGSVVTVSATPNTGYTFVNWTDGTDIFITSSYTFTLNANRTLVANFIPTPGTGIIPPVISPSGINLGTASDFTILTEAGISTTGTTSVTGNIGVSPISATAITGFGLIMNTNGQSSHTPIVSGSVYAADYAAPTPTKMTTAINDMHTAYTTAMGLVTPAPIVDLYAGNISGRILTPGIYKYNTGLLISNAGVVLFGGPNDVWVFQISQDLTVNSGAKITLIGGAQAKNIFWVTAGQATLGSNVNFSGNILSKTLISLNSNATVNGKLLAQTAVTLNASTVTTP